MSTLQVACQSANQGRASVAERGFALLLSALVTLQPALVYGNDIRPVDGATTLDQSANGTTVVNIATPSASGLSHNRYGAFDVSQDGVILNNSRKVVRTDIGGYIDANPHLAGGTARVILNEVLSTDPSSLLGAVEVGGKAADVIIANPHGITCDGCGFINTVRGTLTTGVPQVENGALQGWDVRGGTIAIEGDGARMQGASRFDAIAGAIRLNAELHGKDLNLISGHHQVAYEDLSGSVNGAAPEPGAEFAISSSALGGIYGDRIRLVATDAGVGVRLDAPVAAQLGNVDMDVAGNLHFVRLSAADDVLVRAGSVHADGAITARDQIQLQVDHGIELSADTSEARRVQVNAQSLQVDQGAAIASTVLQADLAQLQNDGIIQAEVATITTTDTLGNQGLLEGRHLTLASPTLDNTDGEISATGRLVVTVDDYDHRGDVQAGDLTLASAGDIRLGADVEWKLAGGASLSAAAEFNNAGILSSADNLVLHAAVVDNQGSLAARNDLNVTAPTINNHAGALMLAGQNLTLTATEVTNAGDLYAVIDLVLSGADDSAAHRLLNAGGFIGTGQGDIDLHATHITNTGVGEFLGDITWGESQISFPGSDVGDGYNERCFLRNRDNHCRTRAYQDTTREQVITEDQRTPDLLPVSGVILAGGNADIRTHVLENLHSLLGAHGSVTIKLQDNESGEKGRVVNQGYDVALQREVRTDASWYKQTSGALEENRKYTYSTIPFHANPERCRNSRVRCGRGEAVIDQQTFTETVLGSRIAAGGEVRILNGGHVGNGSIDRGTSFVGNADALRGDHLQDPTLYRLDPIVTGGLALPGRNGLFLFNSSPGHPYLIETNPLFASHSGFMGSSYMLERLGWNAESGQRLLGDAFYELNLLQQALMGQPVLAGATQQEREAFLLHLMDQGIAAAESLELAVGVTLNAEQINQLQSDIIWLEERQVAGHTVLVPVVYLANGIQAPDAVIAGSSVNIQATSADNAGTVRATGTLDINATAGNLLNTGTLLAGTEMTLKSGGDIVNRSGTVRGGTVTLDAGGHIIHETELQTNAQGGQIHTLAGRVGVIEATGELRLESDKDVVIRGAHLNANKLDVDAGGNVKVEALEIRRSYNMNGKGSNRMESVTHLTSELTSVLDMLIQAEQNITLAGATLTGQSDMTLFAGNDLVIEAVEDHYYSYLKKRSSSTFSSKKVITENSRTEQVGSRLDAEGKLTLTAMEGEVALLASTGYGAEGVSVQAGSNVRIESGVNNEYERTQIIKKNAARVKTHDRGSDVDSLAMAGLVSGADMDIATDGNVTLKSGLLAAGEALRIGHATVLLDESGEMQSDEAGLPIFESGTASNIDIGTVELKSETWRVTTRELRGPVKEVAKVAAAAGGTLIAPALGVTGMDMEVVVSSKKEDRTEISQEVGSMLQGHNVSLSARDEVKLIGSTVMADEVQGSVEVQANTIRLDTAATKTTHTLVKEEQTVAGVKPSASKDEITAGGFSVTDHKEETITVTESHAGSALSGNNIVLRADSSISLVNADVMATGEDGNLVLNASEVTVTGVQDTQQINHTEETQITTITAGIRNAYVDTAYAVKAVEEAGEGVDRARRALSDAERSYDKGEISAGALDDYKAMLAMATANFVQAELAAAQALAAAAVTAGSSAGTGFYVSGSAQVTETRSKSNDNTATWQGSSLSAANMSINADAASIIGSDISAGALAMNADKILLGAGTNTQSSNFEQESRNVSAGVSSSGAGSWNASVGYNEASSSSEATQHVNTRINVGHLSSTSDELTLRGAIVTADTADITTHTLTVESLQDTHKSKNSSMGVNVGIGAGNDSVGKPQSGSGGGNFAKGDSKGAITGEQTAILIGNGADSQITAKDTHLIGGMIANASWEMPEGADENTEPVLVDHGQLNFTTDTLTVTDLRDYSRSSQTGGGLQFSASTTTISATDEGHRMEGMTQATIGGGNVLVGGVALNEHADLTDLNRDLDKGQIVTLDQQTGAMNASVTFDNRMFQYSKEDGFYGWKSISEQHANLGTNMQAVIGGVGSEVNLGINLGVRIAGVDNPAATTEKIDDKLGWWGLIPAGLNNGGLLAQLAGQLLPGSDAHQRQIVGATADSPYVLANPEMGWIPITETPGYYLMNPAQQESMANVVVSTNPIAIAAGTATYQNSTNGMLNTPALAMYNAVTQTHDLVSDLGQSILVTLNYNPTRGFLADGLESGQDKFAIWSGQSWMATNVAVDTGIFANQVMLARGNERANFANHSQGNLLNFSGLLAVGLDKDIVFGPIGDPNFTWNMFGSPVNAVAFDGYLSRNDMLLTSSSVNSGDFVGQGLGGNNGLYVYGKDGQEFNVVHYFSNSSGAFVTEHVTAVSLEQTQQPSGSGSLLDLFSSSSPHSNYSCVARCGAEPQKTKLPSATED